jgi:hypothetical protein
MGLSGSWMISTFSKLTDAAGKKLDIGIAPTPIGPTGKRASMFNGLADSVTTLSKQPENAAKWVKFMSGEQCQNIIGESGVVFPARPDGTELAIAFNKTKRKLDVTPFTDQVKDKTTFLFPVTNNAADIIALMNPADGRRLHRQRPGVVADETEQTTQRPVRGRRVRLLVTGGPGTSAASSSRTCSTPATTSRSWTTCRPATPVRWPQALRSTASPSTTWARCSPPTPDSTGCCTSRRRSRRVSRSSGRNCTGTPTSSARWPAGRGAGGGRSRLVFSSTAAVYGNPVEVPITEDAAVAPTNPYGWTKLAVDARDRPRLRGTRPRRGEPALLQRRGCLPPDRGPPLGERHDPETHLIPIALEVAAGDGRNCRSTATTTRRRTAPACATTFTSRTWPPPTCWPLPLPSGPAHGLQPRQRQRFSNRQVVDVVRAVTGAPVPVIAAPRRSGDPSQLVASSARARADLGWVPAKPDLRDIVADAWAFLSTRGPAA